MTFADTTSDNDGTEPTAKHVDPIMKRTPTHQPISCGAHRTAWGRRPSSVLLVDSVGLGARRGPYPFRCRRAVNSTTSPSGRRTSSRMTKGPQVCELIRTQPTGSSHVAVACIRASCQRSLSIAPSIVLGRDRSYAKGVDQAWRFWTDRRGMPESPAHT